MGLSLGGFSMGDFGSFGGSGGVGNKASSSSTSSTTNTTNTDRRLVVGEGAVGLSSDGGTISVTNNSLSPLVMEQAFAFADAANVANSNAFSQLTKSSQSMFDTATNKVASAYEKALVDSRGSVEQKTIIVIALGLVAFGIAWAFRNKIGKG